MMRIVAMLTLALIVSGCSSNPVPTTNDYLLVHPAQTKPLPVLPAAAPSLLLQQVSLAPHLRGLHILRPSGRLDELVYERPAAPLPHVLTSWLREDLLRSGHFTQVIPPDDPGQASMRLSVHCHRFEIIEEPDGSSHALVLLEANMRFDHSTSAPRWSRRFFGERDCPSQPSAKDLVAALSEALGDASGKLSESLPLDSH